MAVYFLEKYDELSESVVAFSQKLKYLLDQNGSEGGPHVFSNLEMNVTDRAEKVDCKNGVIYLVSMFSS